MSFVCAKFFFSFPFVGVGKQKKKIIIKFTLAKGKKNGVGKNIFLVAKISSFVWFTTEVDVSLVIRFAII